MTADDIIQRIFAFEREHHREATLVALSRVDWDALMRGLKTAIGSGAAVRPEIVNRIMHCRLIQSPDVAAGEILVA